MKDLDLMTLLAVFEEMLGWALWPILAGAALATLAFLYVLLRDRGMVSARMLRAELVGVAGGIAAVVTMFAVTNSSVSDLGGPVDWLLVLAIFAMGLIGGAIASYAAMGVLAPAPRRETAVRGRPAEA